MPVSDQLKKIREKGYSSSKEDSSKTISRTLVLTPEEKEYIGEKKEGEEVMCRVTGVIGADGKLEIMKVDPMESLEDESEEDGMSKEVAMRVEPTIQPSPS